MPKWSAGYGVIGRAGVWCSITFIAHRTASLHFHSPWTTPFDPIRPSLCQYSLPSPLSGPPARFLPVSSPLSPISPPVSLARILIKPALRSPVGSPHLEFITSMKDLGRGWEFFVPFLALQFTHPSHTTTLVITTRHPAYHSILMRPSTCLHSRMIDRIAKCSYHRYVRNFTQFHSPFLTHETPMILGLSWTKIL